MVNPILPSAVTGTLSMGYGIYPYTATANLKMF